MAESDSTHGLPEYGQMMTPAENPPDMLNSDASSADKQPSLKRFRAWAIVLAAVIGLAVGIGAGYPLGRQAESKAREEAAQASYQKEADKYNTLTSKLKKTSDACQPTDSWSQMSDSLEYAKDGTLSLSTTKYSVNTTLECVEEQLDMPSALTSQIGMTNAYNGVQNEYFGGYTVTWSYNGNKGLSFTVVPTMEKPQEPAQ